MHEESKHATYLDIRIIILIGSLAMVKMNIAKGGPNARKPHPKNSMTVMIAAVYSYSAARKEKHVNW